MQFIDTDSILSTNQHWQELDQKWGAPVDLDTTDSKDSDAARRLPAYSIWSLNRTTFDSSKYIRKLKEAKEATAQLRDTLPDYEDFSANICRYGSNEGLSAPSAKAFFFVAGNIVSQRSVENICEEIDYLFSGLETIHVATSTIRPARKTPFQKKASSIISSLRHSISMSGLSFDDTATEEELGSGRQPLEAALKISSASLQGIIGYIDRLFDSLDKTV